MNLENLGVDLENKEQFYQQMCLVRTLENAILDLFSQNELTGTTHTYLGQEANAVGVINAIDRNRDTVWSNHRSHGHFLAYCGDVKGLVAEIMGRETGVCGGRGGSQHLCAGRFHSNGVQGGIIPLAVGTALADRSDNAITVAFLGDGTMGQGLIYESLNLAALWSAPILMVVEDNEIAQTTPSDIAVSGSIVARAHPFGIKTFEYEGTDVFAVHGLAQKAVTYVRKQGKPAWFVIKTHRMGPHSKGDDTRPDNVIAEAQAADPLKKIRSKLSDDDVKSIDLWCHETVEVAISSAKETPSACV